MGLTPHAGPCSSPQPSPSVSEQGHTRQGGRQCRTSPSNERRNTGAEPLPGSWLLDKVAGPGAPLPLQKETRLLNGGCYLVPSLDGKDFHNAAFSCAAVIQPSGNQTACSAAAVVRRQCESVCGWRFLRLLEAASEAPR